MVAFSTADLPPTINTVEGLSAWCACILSNLHFQQTFEEAPGIVEKIAVSQNFPVLTNGVYEWRQVSRTSLKLNSDFQKTGKVWNHVQPMSNASIPADFKS